MQKVPVQRYLDAIGIDSSIPPKLYQFGLLRILPIGKKRTEQLICELETARPNTAPSRDQRWIYEIALQVTQQEITYQNLCATRIEKRDPDFELFLSQRSYREVLFKTNHAKYTKFAAQKRDYPSLGTPCPSLLEMMQPLDTEQTELALQQLSILLDVKEQAMMVGLYRDHLLKKTVAGDLKLPLKTARDYKKSALRKLKANWLAPQQIFIQDPQLSVVAPQGT